MKLDLQRSSLASASAVALVVAMLAAPAHAATVGEEAQAADAAPAAESNEATPENTDAEITVTGSRVARAGFTTPTPVTVMDTESLTKAAPSTLAEALRELPSLTNTSGPQRNSGTANGGQSFLNLRSLGATRTLTLLDTRRVVSTNLTGSVDVNIMPSGIIQRVEVVTGGASAAYGSDAVAGVVNFLIDKKFTGLKGELNKGISQYGDNAETRATLSGGLEFAGGRGHVLASAEYFKNDGVAGGARDWARHGVALINNPAAPPTFLVKENVLTVGTYGGLITTGTGGTAANNALFKGIQFLPGGVAAPYNFGTWTTSTQQIGGDGVASELVQEINRPLERGSAYGRLSFDASDNLTLSADVMYGRSVSDVVNSFNRRQTANPLSLKADNAFLPAALRTQMQAAGVTGFTFLRFSRERGFVYTHVDSATLRSSIGADGKLGSLKWNVYYQYGRTTQNNEVRNDEITANMNLAADAVFVTPANVGTSGFALGSIVCRSSLTAPTNGCVPFNVFGEGSPSEAALNYTRGTSRSDAVLRQDVVAGSISGPIVDGWAGPISFATGAEYRKESVVLTTDARSPTGAFLFGNPTPWSGAINVKEAFAELVVPLLKDVPLARDVELNAAGRVTDYSTSGTVKTWKAGLSWRVFDDLRLRGTRSRDIRAPNLSELFQAGRQSITSFTDPFNNNTQVSGVPQINVGNPNLTPEFADTLTVGAVYSPSWAPGLNLSVDYYDIKIRDAIGSIGSQTAINQCKDGVAIACALFEKNSAGAYTKFYSQPINLSAAATRGVDIELAYRYNPELTFRALAAYVSKQMTQTPGAAPVDSAGEVGVSPFPKWRGTAQVNYDGEKFGGFLQGRFIGSGRYDLTRGPTVVDLQDIPAQFYLDGQISAKVKAGGKDFELFLNVRNLLNHQPPFTPQNGNIPVPVNTTLYDTIGRTFRVGFKFRM